MNIHYYTKQTKRNTQLQNIKRKLYSLGRILSVAIAIPLMYLVLVIVLV